jgi:hypothetical protein
MSELTPVFIGGAGRSGTTLVVDMLGLHSRLSPIYETDFIVAFLNRFYVDQQTAAAQSAMEVREFMDKWTKPLPMRPHNKRPHEKYHHGPHYVLFDRQFALARTEELAQAIEAGHREEGFHSFIAELFAEHCRIDRKPRWVNKTPAYVHHLDKLRQLFPDMRFIHCLRDGRDVACSVVSRPWGPKNFDEAAVWWSSKVQPGVDFGRQHPEQYLEVRYEDLLQKPEEHLGRILAWLGEPAEEKRMLACYAEKGLPLDSGRMGGWKQSFTDKDTQGFNRLAGDLLKALGYGEV